MKFSLWRKTRRYSLLSTLAAVLFAIAPAMRAQCANGTVSLRGKVENLDSPGNLRVLIIVQTAKYTYSQVSLVTNKQFNVVVPFSQRGSYSPLWGERCSNPKIVNVEVKDGEKVLVQRKLKISTDFEPNGALSYALRRELILDASSKD